MPEQASAFDAHDLKDELRPPELTDDDQLRVRDDAANSEGLLPEPVLDPQHGEVRVLNDRVVQVFTDEDIYHELVEWLDEVFEISRGYEVYFLEVEAPDSRSDIEPHALVVLRDDDDVYEHDLGDGIQVYHEYKRGDHAGELVTGTVTNGGVSVWEADHETEAMAPTKAAKRADEFARGDDARGLGYNGWDWWEVGGDIGLTLGDLRR